MYTFKCPGWLHALISLKKKIFIYFHFIKLCFRLICPSTGLHSEGMHFSSSVSVLLIDALNFNLLIIHVKRFQSLPRSWVWRAQGSNFLATYYSTFDKWNQTDAWISIKTSLKLRISTHGFLHVLINSWLRLSCGWYLDPALSCLSYKV